MTTNPSPPVAHELGADEICWKLQPAPEALRDPADQLVDAILDAVSYRTLGQQAIHALHELTVRHRRLRDHHAQLLAEHRAIRAATLKATSV